MALSVILVFSFLLPLLVIVLWLKWKFTSSQGNLPPGPPVKLLVGEIFNLKPRLYLYFHNLCQHYGDIASFEVVLTRVVVVSSLKAAREAFHQTQLSGRLSSEFMQQSTHNSGIAFIDGPVWTAHRRKTMKILRDFGMGKSVFVTTIQRETVGMCEQIATFDSQPVNTIDFFSVMIGNIICELVFGSRPGYDEQSEFNVMAKSLHSISLDTNTIAEFVVSLPGLERLTMHLLPKVKKIQNIFEMGHDFILKKLNEHRNVFVPTEEPSDFIFAYLQEQTKNCPSGQVNFDDWKIIRVALELFIAGTDTTAVQLSWVVLLMALHPDVRQKAMEEIHSMCGCDRIVSMEDRKRLNYTQAVIDEVIRYSAITSTGGLPHRAMEATKVMGYDIPKDALVYLNFYSITRDPQIWKHPNSFNPDNFLNDSGIYTPSEHLIPFSVGNRACVGESLARMEIFIFSVTLLQKYRFQLAPLEEGDSMEDILLGSDGAIRCPGKHKILFIRQ